MISLHALLILLVGVPSSYVLVLRTKVAAVHESFVQEQTIRCPLLDLRCCDGCICSYQDVHLQQQATQVSASSYVV